MQIFPSLLMMQNLKISPWIKSNILICKYFHHCCWCKISRYQNDSKASSQQNKDRNSWITISTSGLRFHLFDILPTCTFFKKHRIGVSPPVYQNVSILEGKCLKSFLILVFFVHFCDKFEKKCVSHTKRFFLEPLRFLLFWPRRVWFLINLLPIKNEHNFCFTYCSHMGIEGINWQPYSGWQQEFLNYQAFFTLFMTSVRFFENISPSLSFFNLFMTSVRFCENISPSFMLMVKHGEIWRNQSSKSIF